MRLRRSAILFLSCTIFLRTSETRYFPGGNLATDEWAVIILWTHDRSNPDACWDHLNFGTSDRKPDSITIGLFSFENRASFLADYRCSSPHHQIPASWVPPGASPKVTKEESDNDSQNRQPWQDIISIHYWSTSWSAGHPADPQMDTAFTEIPAGTIASPFFFLGGGTDIS